MSFNPKQYLTKLRGQDYLEVKWRIVWFRDEHPDGHISTEIVNYDPLVVKAKIYTPGDEVFQLIATGHGSASSEGRKVVWSGREIEKAETAAIGRALAHAGYGTQFTGEVEGEHLADSPIETTEKKSTNGKPRKDGGVPFSLQMLVDDGLFDNSASAASVFNRSPFTKGAHSYDDEMKPWFKAYRAWRDIDTQPDEAIELANAGELPH